MPQATLKRSTDREIALRFDHLWGWIFLLLGPGLLGLWPVLEPGARLWVAGFAALMGLFGLLTVLRRFELRVDLPAGTWHRRQGFWPRIESSSGPVSEITAVSVKTSLGTRKQGGAGLTHRVELVFDSPQWPQNLRYLRTDNAAAAAEQARRVAEPLGVPVVEGSVPKPPAD